MKSRTEAYRLCERYANRYMGQNRLFDLLPESLHDALNEIVVSDVTLKDAYVCHRYGALEGSAMNWEYQSEFGDNRFARWVPDKGKWQLDTTISEYAKAIQGSVTDLAELNIIDELMRVSGRLPMPERDPGRSGAVSAGRDRLLFVQGGVGCGKSTMLHHLSRITLPMLTELNLLPRRFHTAVFDLNGYPQYATAEHAWTTIIRSFRTLIAEKTGLDTSVGWRDIAREDLLDLEGHTIPDITESPDPAAATKEIVHRSADHAVFLHRVARSLSRRTPPATLLIVLDNVDRISSVSSQTEVIQRFVELLENVRNAIGIIAVREYTLGTLEALHHPDAFYRASRLHMTTPLIGEMLRRRFDLTLNKIDEKQAQNITVQIRPGVTVSQLDLRDVLRHIAKTFEVEDRQVPADIGSDEADLDDSLKHPALFLHNVTNSNMRAALALVIDALSSWALGEDRIVMEYLWQKARGRIQLRPFTVDQLVLLSTVGSYECYDHTKCVHVYNVLSTADIPPNYRLGRSALLHTYRILQAVYSAGRKASVKDLLDRLSCLPFHAAENIRVLEHLVRRGFIEAREGMDLDKADFVYSTRKLRFYLKVFSRSLVYIDAIRNDSYLEYPATRRTVGVGLAQNLIEAFRFIYYIMEQEEMEYSVVRYDADKLDRFRSFAGTEPICWATLCSIVRHANLLYARNKRVIRTAARASVLEEFERTKAGIYSRSRRDRIYPKVPRGRLSLEFD